VQDHSAEAVERMRSLGATAGTLTQIGEECQVVFLCLPTSAHVRQVVFGPEGLVRSLTPGTLIIDQTTGDPGQQLLSTTQRLLSFEGVMFAAKNGVDPKIATEVLVASGARNAYLDRMMGPRVLNGKLNVGFTLGLAHKDVRLALQMALIRACRCSSEISLANCTSSQSPRRARKARSTPSGRSTTDWQAPRSFRLTPTCPLLKSRGTAMPTEMFEKGLAIRRELVGAAAVDKAFADASDFSRPMQEFVTGHCHTNRFYWSLLTPPPVPELTIPIP